MTRPATLTDLDALLDLERRCFDSDRLNRRQFRYLLTRAQAETLVAERSGRIVGYAIALYRRGTSLGRLYSIAVDPEARGAGIGTALLAAAEASALERECAYLRLEVRRDNAPTIALYRKAGYRPFEEVKDYYEDGMAAVRMEKTLVPHLSPALARVPYYRQTLDFTCGSSALLMAMNALDPAVGLTRSLELRIWREATTVFMTSGHGGCGPFGLALAAADRGFRAEVYVNDRRVPMIDSVRSPEKKEVMRLVHEDMVDEVRQRGIPVAYRTLALDALERRFDAGGIPIVLISSYRIYHAKVPHWIVVTGFDERFVYANDPFVDDEREETETDSINMPVLRSDFSRMARYGRAGLQAVVMIYPGTDSPRAKP